MTLDPEDYTIDDLEDALEDVEDVDALDAIWERERWGLDRVGAKSAIEERIDEVGGRDDRIVRDASDDGDAADGSADVGGGDAPVAPQTDGAGARRETAADGDGAVAESSGSSAPITSLGSGLDGRSLAIGAILGIAVMSIPSFLDHYLYFMTGQVDQVVIRKRWDLVAINAVGFLLFLIPLTYRRKADWTSMGVYAAFIVSLFVEMYGVPLTIYLSSAALVDSGARPPPDYIVEFSVLGQSFGMDLWTVIGAVITAVGMLIVAVGWVTIYRATEEDELVTTGVYRFSRHPQYVGIAMIALGWFVGWPTFLTTLIFPVLIVVYYRAAQQEESEVMEEIDDPVAYERYRRQTPMFI